MMLINVRLFVLVLILGLVYLIYLNKGSRISAIFWKSPKQSSIDLFFRLDAKLRFIYENVDHMVDFRISSFDPIQQNTNKLKDVVNSSQIRNHSYKLKAAIEKLYLFNKYKRETINEISKSIQAKIDQLQAQKCHLDQIVFARLEPINCGYGCQMHTLSVAFLISYYWEKTLIYAKNRVQGLEEFEQIFLPIANKCKFHNLNSTKIVEETIRPYMVNSQHLHSLKLFKKFYSEVHELAKYHSDPEAFIIGHLMSYVLRYNPESSFYKHLAETEHRFNLSRPYVGIHVRRSDKHYEAKFYEVQEYMKHVEEFYEIYFLKYPERVNTTRRTVFVASDETSVFSQLETKFPEYRFVYNNSFTSIAGNYTGRYSQLGFESFLFDLYFLSRADHLVCTFSSNVCRLAYELLVPKAPDTHRMVVSLDIHYFNLFAENNYRIAVLDNKAHDFWFKKGALIEKQPRSGPFYDGYRHDGFIIGILKGTEQSGVVASYKTKDYY